MDKEQRDGQRTEPLILAGDTSKKSWEYSQKTTPHIEVTFDSLCLKLIGLLPVLKEPYKKEKTVLSGLVIFLEQIQDHTILPDHLPFLLFCDSVFLREARTRNENPPQPHHECNLFHDRGVKLMGQQFGKYMTGDEESLFHFNSINRETGIEAVSEQDQVPAMVNVAVEELGERPPLSSHDERNDSSIEDDEVLLKKIKKEVTDWTVENMKIEEESVPELYFNEDPDMKEESKPLVEDIEPYDKDEADVKDELNTILKLEEFKDAGPSTLIKEAQSANTRSKTDFDVAYLMTFLEEVKGIIGRKLEEFTEEEIVLYMSEFFLGIKKKKDGSEYEPASLWAIFASIKRYLKENNYTFSTSPPLQMVTDVLRAKSKLQKKKGDGNLPQKSDALTKEEIKKFYEIGVTGCHNPRALNNAMAINCLYLGFRGGQELYNRCLGDFKVISVDNVIYLTVCKERVTKTRSGKSPRDLHSSPRLVEIPGSNSCPVMTYLTLCERRPPKFKDADSPLFLRAFVQDPIAPYSTNKAWYFNSRVGITEVAKFVKKMSEASNMDFNGRKITNTSARKALATSLLQDNALAKTIMRQMGHTNPNSLIRYDEPSSAECKTVTKILFGKDDTDGKNKLNLAVDELLEHEGSHSGASGSTSTTPQEGEAAHPAPVHNIFNIQF